jgi:hypothetical protein
MKPIATFGSPISDMELWRCAQQQLALHGIFDAVAEANRRMFDLGEIGDRTGANTWMAITLRVLYLAQVHSNGPIQ